MPEPKATEEAVPEVGALATAEGGAFLDSLKRNNKKIREDRAVAIHEDVSLLFRRELEDIELGIKRMRRERENMLDLSPENATSLVLASDFDSGAFVAKEIALAVKIRNEEIKYQLVKERNALLFGSVN